MIDGKVSPILANEISNRIGTVTRGANPDPIILTVLFIAIVSVVLKTTNLRPMWNLWDQPKWVRLNGIDPKRSSF